ncbi:hypothetical protein K5I29_05580 [Flavobacterium agricola]|uniref:Secreted protein n=1 Tax=Flavobacterium agricola TaxID=2870839 RepID=A0ABY6M444_9FLAO|nr:hypothetical protein [Flavobacterium agricola]UYW02365.1 hypothetical protein K5I29_05580 [Flavobacterium agricola]
MIKNLKPLLFTLCPFILHAQVGIGTITPQSALHIVSQTPGALTIQDGTQEQNKILTSDRNGKATWGANPALRPTILGTFPTSSKTITSGTSSGYKFLETSITLPKGKWIIHAGIHLQNTSRYNSIKNVNAFISTTTNSTAISGFEFIGHNSSLKSIQGKIDGKQVDSFIQGVFIINVIVDNLKINLLLNNVWDSALLSPTEGMWTFTTDKNENYLFALPIN